MIRRFALLVLSIVLGNGLFAQLRLPAILGSHMVLQQNKTTQLWGWRNPWERLTIKLGWDTTTYVLQGDKFAKWSLDIQTPKAGGPYTISIKGNTEILLEDVLIGETWLCSGQSNMEMYVRQGLPYQADVQAATNPQIRLFYVAKATADFPQDDVTGKWVVCNPSDMENFSAIGYFFGQKLQQNLHCAVGLINSNWGGTSAEEWTPKEALALDPVLKANFRIPPLGNASLYNAMIAPINHFAIAGTIWYQGEDNVPYWNNYRHLFSTLIQSWRTARNDSFPFYYVQIAPYAHYKEENTLSLLREAQTECLSVPHTGMVLTSDLVDNINDIHPKMKKEVALRLADYALAETYHLPIKNYKSPQLKNYRIEKNKIRIDFENADGGLFCKGDTVKEFTIAGKDRKFHPAQARIEGRSIVVWSSEVPEPVAVRFNFGNTSVPNLFGKNGLPVNLFRTDDWKF